MIVAGARSPPAVIRSSSGHSVAGGNRHELAPTGCGLDDQSVKARSRTIDRLSAFVIHAGRRRIAQTDRASSVRLCGFAQARQREAPTIELAYERPDNRQSFPAAA